MSRFDALSITGYSRRNAFLRRLPKVKRVSDEELKFVKDLSTINVFDIFEQNYIPPESDLLNWRCRLRHMAAMALEKPVVTTDHGTFTLEIVEDAIKLHKAKVIHKCVSQETNWFNTLAMIPHSIAEPPSPNSLKNFKNIIYNTPHNEMTDLGMTPDELSRLCSTRYLSGDHMHWFVDKLNSMQSETHCVYINRITNIERYVEQKIGLQPPPDCLAFIINVGNGRSGNVYIGSDSHPGNHWTFMLYNASNRTLTYGDSLGWSFPSGLLDKACEYIHKIYAVNDVPTVKMCHDPEINDNKGRHFCNKDVCKMYPLQKCYNICGPVAVIVMAISVLNKSMFDVITGPRSTTSPHLYITEPTAYNKYIRQVLMSWMADDNIDVKNVVPNAFITDETISGDLRDHIASDSDEEDSEETVKVTFEDIPTVAESPSSCPKRSDGRFYCNNCNKSYSRMNDLKRHIVKAHGEDKSDITNSGDCLCLECGHRCRKMSKLREHLSTAHLKDMNQEVIIFPNTFEFENWKCDLEEKSKCSYVKCSGVIHKDDGTLVQHFKCNRSGKFKTRRIGKRRMKSSGSCKLEKNCTSSIKVITQDDGSLQVSVCYTHYGHTVDLEHIRFSKRQRQEIAAKLSIGVSREKILDDIRDEVGSDFVKMHLLDKQDISNIGRSYNIQTTIRHDNDQQSVLSWINEWQEMEHNPVLYYNLQGQQPDFSCMKADDFMIIIQTEAQKLNLQKFGENGVCADATHGTTGYDFLLCTLLVIDEFGHGQPAGWCLATHETEQFLKIFFQKIADNSGICTPRWFMSDLASQYYNAFCTVNKCSPKWLFCTWHVDKAWKKELKEKIKSSAIEAELYLKLRTVLEITNENLFETALQWLVKSINDSNETKDFAAYFESRYVSCKRQWGYCFRVGEGINTNMFVESFHRTLKHVYFKGKHNKRVDNLLVNLMKFSRNEVFNRLIRLTKGKQTTRQKLVGDRHSASLKISFDDITKEEDTYVVKSQTSNNHFYKITQVVEMCERNNCAMKCHDCFVCSHTFDCTCPDFLIKGAICKHVHLVKRYIDENAPSKKECNTVKTTGYAAAEITDTFRLIADERPAKFEEYTTYKAKVVTQLHSLIKEVESCSSNNIEGMKLLNKQLTAASNTFQSMMINKNLPKLIPNNNHPANKNIEIQGRFKSVKRKPKTTGRVRLAKPTSKEKEHFLAMLSQPNTTSTDDIIYTDDERFVLEHLNADKLVKEGAVPSEDEISGEIIECDIPTITSAIKKRFQKDSWVHILKIVRNVHESWKCPVCQISKFEPMVECEGCEIWFHWPCVSRKKEIPNEWNCQNCIQMRKKPCNQH